MRAHPLCLVILSLFFCCQTSASSTPGSYPAFLVLTDSISPRTTTVNTMPVKAKRTGFFGKVKEKVVSFLLKRQMASTNSSSAKSILGWVALGLVLLGIGALILSISSGGLLLLIGMLTGIVSLVWPRTKTEKAEKKNKSTGGLIALIVGGLLVIVAAIALSGSSWR